MVSEQFKPGVYVTYRHVIVMRQDLIEGGVAVKRVVSPGAYVTTPPRPHPTYIPGRSSFV